ncbi:PfkB family carbohydrate kinase [Georgenia yuyongxinii]|uniref:Carbohydrate kinase n=1 Tax=Georgenia yuyongxinii TaxID=2589797 RepID=A0A552WQC9_9MICO|nr:PfkB family carbohydrate kinase [Georgenia yuyongxinii]TRW44894.1 carbohydrate kinase [Georgenia yuyongxinii]
MSRVVCCGLTTLDLTQVVDRVPAADEKVVARSVTVDVGGPAANAARTVGALQHPVTLVTALGAGPVADLARELLAAEGVEVVDVAADDGAPALSTVLVTAGTGERAVVSTNAVGRATAAPPGDVLDRAGALLVDGHLLAAQTALAREARARGAVVLLDGGSWKPGLEDLLAHVDVALLSADFTLPPELTGDARARDAVLDAAARLGPVFVAQSHGQDPIRVLAEGRRYTLPVPHVPAEEVVDTLGAGDVLHGVTAMHLANGASWRNAVARGARVASRSVRYAGALGWAAGG